MRYAVLVAGMFVIAGMPKSQPRNPVTGVPTVRAQYAIPELECRVAFLEDAEQVVARHNAPHIKAAISGLNLYVVHFDDWRSCAGVVEISTDAKRLLKSGESFAIEFRRADKDLEPKKQ